MTAGLEIHSETSVEASIPEVGKAGEKFGWKLSLSGTHARSETVKRTLNWEKSGTLQPGDAINLQALTRRGQITLDYEGMFEVTLENDESFKYPVKGVYEGLMYTSVEITQITPDAAASFHNLAATAEPHPVMVEKPLPVAPALA